MRQTHTPCAQSTDGSPTVVGILERQFDESNKIEDHRDHRDRNVDRQRVRISAFVRLRESVQVLAGAKRRIDSASLADNTNVLVATDTKVLWTLVVRQAHLKRHGVLAREDRHG